MLLRLASFQLAYTIIIVHKGGHIPPPFSIIPPKGVPPIYENLLTPPFFGKCLVFPCLIFEDIQIKCKINFIIEDLKKL